MKIIGIMGGSGCGKSYLCALLQEMGACAVDADAVYHRLLEKNRAMLEEIGAAFGKEVLPGGKLDRRALADIVFQDEQKLKQLNAITHPYVTEEIQADLDAKRAQGCKLYLIDAPLLYQTPLLSLCGEVIYVFCPFEKRVERIMRRDGLSRAQAEQRILAQPEDQAYRKFATRCIDGSQSREKLLEILRGVTH